jgi:pre-mRNA-splicing factor 38A
VVACFVVRVRSFPACKIFRHLRRPLCLSDSLFVILEIFLSGTTEHFARKMETRRRTSGDGQLFIEKIVRLRIRESRYWKEHCFGLTAERLVDKAVELNCIGGVASENNKPTPFLCLLLKMLALAPAHDIILEFVRNEEFKYVRCLGAMYLRLVGLPEDVYEELEPLLADYRKISVHRKTDWALSTVDQFIDGLLVESTACDIALPHLPTRQSLVAAGKLKSRIRPSTILDEFLALNGLPAPNESDESNDELEGDESNDEEEEEDGDSKKRQKLDY